MNLGRDMKGNNKVFYRHINIKRKTRKNMGRCLMEQETWRQRTQKKPKFSKTFSPWYLLVGASFSNPRP